uniref:Trafficking kinesin protein 1 n=1 Tax=Nothobranchius furzeri TaxID=105023 RepID=A0A8C6KNA4_NOTFU
LKRKPLLQLRTLLSLSADVCNGTDLPELEIISILEEQLPVYKLRADSIFGYEQDDWLHTPFVDPDAALDLTTEQIEETLKYFLLCADRVGQMTKTYSDIDAVTRLLEEVRRDLELAARIGQSLLKKNKALSDRNEVLEEQIEHVREEVSQLRHDLSMKDELLQFYTNAAEESEGESNTSTPVRPSEPSVAAPACFPVDSLQKKLKDLEEENKSLRSAANHLETETISYEEKEQQLVNDCVKELRGANLQISSLAEDLARKTEDASRQQEEITHLLSQIVDLQKKAKLYAVENEELTQHLGAAKDAQRQLTAELQELQDKYVECMEMLHEAQEELKNLRNKNLPLSTPRRFHSLGLFPMDSLAAEIEGTMRKELQMDDPDVEEQRLHPKRVFQTVKNLNLMRRSPAAPSPLNIPGSNQTSCLNSGPEDSNKRPPGTPGTPGSRDLEAALRRLSLRRDNYLSEKRFFEEERERKLAFLAKEEEKEGGEGSRGAGTPTESLLSFCSHPSFGSVWSGFSITARSYLPEKLQIVKPLEGSATLHAWQQLAQPHMGALMDRRPGVVTKGFCTLAHEQEQEVSWDLDQPEEDEVSCDSFTGSAPPSPPAVASSPSSTNFNTPSHSPSPVPFSAPPTPSYTPCCTPRRLSLSQSSTNLRDSTKTTSTSLGLVRLLLERGISASVYNPCSWDRALDAGGASAVLGGVPAQVCSMRSVEGEIRKSMKRPDTLLLQPSTPPSSPRSRSASFAAASPEFQFSPLKDDPPYYDAFLASKPARIILREVLGDLERERGIQEDEDSQSEVTNLGLVDKLKRFRTLSPLSASASSSSALLAPFGSSGLGSSVLGGGLPGLNAGLRRNRSYPAMVGASMAMKDPGGPPCTLIPQTVHDTEHKEERDKETEWVVQKAVRVPQTLHALEAVVRRHARPDCSYSAPQERLGQEETGT